MSLVKGENNVEALVVRKGDGEICGFVKHNPALGNLHATCEAHASERCIKTRTLAHNPAKRGTGRPLGFLCGWLADAARFPDKESHMKHCPELLTRQQARQRAKREWNAEAFFNLEHVADDEDGSEPETVPKR